MQGLGGTGAQQSKDCSFEAGSISGAPLRISWFLVIFFAYKVIDEFKNSGLPLWVRLTKVIVSEGLLLLTVLCHEMGHGTMARRKGGEIAEVLLWPFGGICFTTRASGRGPREKLVDDLWIVGAGPVTHFPMAAIWVTLVSATAACFSHVVTPPSWHHLSPFSSPPMPCMNEHVPFCFHSYGSYLLYSSFVQAVQLNVMLFIFNVFFPMYPMDGAKLIVCSLQLFCGTSARCAAKVLVYTSTPLAIFFIGRSFMGMRGQGGFQPGVMMFLGFMCLAESYKIWKLMKEERLYTHPLFELARSSTREVSDSMGTSARLNTATRDDEEAPSRRAPQTSFTELRPFTGAGHVLSGAPAAAAAAAEARVEMNCFVAGPSGATAEASGRAAGRAAAGGGGGAAGGPAEHARAAWLDRLDRERADKAKSVRELEDEKLEQMERERLTQGGRLA